MVNQDPPRRKWPEETHARMMKFLQHSPIIRNQYEMWKIMADVAHMDGYPTPKLEIPIVYNDCNAKKELAETLLNHGTVLGLWTAQEALPMPPPKTFLKPCQMAFRDEDDNKHLAIELNTFLWQ